MKRWMRGSAGSVLWAMLVAIVAASSGPVKAQQQEVRLSAKLSGPAINGVVPSGSAEFEEQANVGKFKTQVQNVNLPDGTVLVATINNISQVGSSIIASFTLSGGQGRVELQGPMPALQAGNTVLVSTVGGTILMTGPLQ